MEKKFEFKKISDDKYAFVMKTDDIERTELVNKDFAKKHYEELVTQKRSLVENMNRLNKEIEKSGLQHDDEIEHFLEIANKAGEYKKYLDAKNNVESTMKMVDEINTSMHQMEVVLTELLRNKKG